MTELTIVLIVITIIAAIAALTFFRSNIKLRRRLIQEVNKLSVTSVSMDEIKERYQKIHKKLDTFSTVIRETDNAVILLDKEGNFEWVNEGFVRLFGITLKEVIQRQGGNILGNSNNPNISEAFARCINRKQTVTYESTFVSADGRKIWTQTALTPVLNHKNEIVRLVAIDTDITRVKEAELKISEQNKKLEKKSEQLKKAADQDDVTGIANYRRFSDFFSREWQRALRDNRPVSLILADIDFFKTFNDTYGRDAGDECLRQIARAIQKMVSRPGDLVARYGGEEFVVVLPDTPLRGAVIVAEKMRQVVEELGIKFQTSKTRGVVTISLGCARMIPSRNLSQDMLIGQADKALYQAKKDGRNRISVAG